MATPDTRVKVGGIIQHTDLCLMGVLAAPDRPGLAGAIFSALGDANLNAEFIVQSIDQTNKSHVQFCVAIADVQQTIATVEPVAAHLGAEGLIHRQPVSLLSVFGPDFRERPGMAGRAFGALAQAGINILAVSTSISTISCVIDGGKHEQALKALHTVFALP